MYLMLTFSGYKYAAGRGVGEKGGKKKRKEQKDSKATHREKFYLKFSCLWHSHRTNVNLVKLESIDHGKPGHAELDPLCQSIASGTVIPGILAGLWSGNETSSARMVNKPNWSDFIDQYHFGVRRYKKLWRQKSSLRFILISRSGEHETMRPHTIFLLLYFPPSPSPLFFCFQSRFYYFAARHWDGLLCCAI